MPINPVRTYSFSGADCKTFVFYEGVEDLVVKLESLHTLSVSVHEAKGQGRALGFRGMTGLARGVRTIAGSMILTVIEDNPMRPLLDMYLEYVKRTGANKTLAGWSIDRDIVGTGTSIDSSQFANRLATLLPPFNLITQYVSESAQVTTLSERVGDVVTVTRDVQGASYLLRDIEIIDEGIVTSSNDTVTEVTISFIARDFKPLSIQSLNQFTGSIESTEVENLDETLRRKLFAPREEQRAAEARALAAVPPRAPAASRPSTEP